VENTRIQKAEAADQQHQQLKGKCKASKKGLTGAFSQREIRQGQVMHIRKQGTKRTDLRFQHRLCKPLEAQSAVPSGQ